MNNGIKWRLVKLSDVAELITGKTPSRQRAEFYTAQDGIPWVKIENLGHRKVYETEEYLTELGAKKGIMIPEDAVLLSTNRTIGKVGIAGRKLQTNQQITAIICKEDSDIMPEYLYYYLKFSEKNIQNMAYATISNRVSKEVLEQFILPIAPLPDQEEWVTLLKYVEDYLWKKEEMLRVMAEYEEKMFPMFCFLKENKVINELRNVTENMKEMIQNLSDSLLYHIFAEIEKKKNLYYERANQEFIVSGSFEKLVPDARKLLQEISSFQRELYRKFYEAEKESAIHEVFKQIKQEDARFGKHDIQSALAAVEALHQIGLLKKEDKKLLYYPGKDPTEENTVRDSNGNDLGIGMWSCIFPKEE